MLAFSNDDPQSTQGLPVAYQRLRRKLSKVGWIDKPSPGTRRLIRENVGRRVLQPFRDMVEGRRPEIYWLHVQNNWNAVCLAGVTGAALALEDSPK